MKELLQKIQQAKPEEIGELFLAALMRYRELYPGWQIEVLTVDKNENQNEQLNRIIGFAEGLKKQGQPENNPSVKNQIDF